jgi:hypothetical protein
VYSTYRAYSKVLQKNRRYYYPKYDTYRYSNTKLLPYSENASVRLLKVGVGIQSEVGWSYYCHIAVILRQIVVIVGQYLYEQLYNRKVKGGLNLFLDFRNEYHMPYACVCFDALRLRCVKSGLTKEHYDNVMTKVNEILR